MRPVLRLAASVLAGLAATLVVAAASAKEKATDPRADWVGSWSAGPEHDIDIATGPDGVLSIEGFASWGASDPERVARGAINFGDFSVSIPSAWIEGSVLAFAIGGDGAVPLDQADEYDCTLQLVLAEDELAVTDNGMCGGHNVSFTGVYRPSP